MRYKLSTAAKRELREIWDYIAQDNMDAADSVVNNLENGFKRLCTYPYLGQPRKDLTEMPVLLYATSGYWVVYEIHAKHLEILRVLSQSQNIPNYLQP